MLKIRRAQECGLSSPGWFDVHHTFSFANYDAPDAMAFPGLPVINGDTVASCGGFAMHGHEDMEMICYLLEKGLEQRDGFGGGSVMRPGDMQLMSAGTGAGLGRRP
jgi:redox-sensitive bicupin YhaK (pirin superfamily)